MAVMTVVAGMLVDGEGRFLMQQRPEGKAHAGLWEFPGGKVEAGETPEAALVRELAEELGIAVDAAALSPVTFASEPLGDRHMVLLLYRCAAWTGDPRAIEATALGWFTPNQATTLPLPPADCAFVRELGRHAADRGS